MVLTVKQIALSVIAGLATLILWQTYQRRQAANGTDAGRVIF